MLMKQLGFRRSKTDPCLYIKDLINGEQIYVLVYVDDCIVIGPKMESELFINQIGDILKIKKLGALKKYNGNDFDIDISGNEIRMSQKVLIESMVKEVNVKPTKIPGYPNEIQIKDTSEPPVNIDRYRRLVGKLLYICNKTCPNIMNQCRELSASGVCCDGILLRKTF